MVVQELGARWKCAGAVLRRDRDGCDGARCTVEVRWNSDERTVMVVQELGEFVEVRWSSDEGTVLEVKELGAC